MNDLTKTHRSQMHCPHIFCMPCKVYTIYTQKRAANSLYFAYIDERFNCCCCYYYLSFFLFFSSKMYNNIVRIIITFCLEIKHTHTKYAKHWTNNPIQITSYVHLENETRFEQIQFFWSFYVTLNQR